MKDETPLRELVKMVLCTGHFFTLGELSKAVGCPEPTVSARLRDLRKAQYGGHQVPRRVRSREGNRVTYEYGIIENLNG